jgi:hypothetical protein
MSDTISHYEIQELRKSASLSLTHGDRPHDAALVIRLLNEIERLRTLAPTIPMDREKLGMKLQSLLSPVLIWMRLSNEVREHYASCAEIFAKEIASSLQEKKCVWKREHDNSQAYQTSCQVRTIQSMTPKQFGWKCCHFCGGTIEEIEQREKEIDRLTTELTRLQKQLESKESAK